MSDNSIWTCLRCDRKTRAAALIADEQPALFCPHCHSDRLALLSEFGVPLTERLDALADIIRAEPGMPAAEVRALLDDDITHAALTNALRMRSIDLDFGHYYPRRPQTIWQPFADVVARHLTGAPIDGLELRAIATDHVVRAPSPKALAAEMNHLGYHHIPGVGWWTSPQWLDPRGHMYTTGPQSERVTLIMQMFAEHGWPLSNQFLERITQGRIERDFLRFNRSKRMAAVQNIGMAMYAPSGAAIRYAVPMSPAIARRMLAYGKAHHLLALDDDMESYRIAVLMGRAGWATVKISYTRRGSKNSRTARIKKITQRCETLLRAFAKAPPPPRADVF